MLRSSTATYEAYVFQTASVRRKVIGSANPSVGTVVCLSGANSANERCNWKAEVINVNFCAGSICVVGTARFSNTLSAWSGDSGGAIYSVNTSGQATARAILSGVPCNCTSLVMYGTMISTALGAVGATVKV